MHSISSVPDTIQDTMKTHNIWTEECPIPLERLRLVTVSYVDFNNETHHNGEIIVLDAVAEHVVLIFKELFEQRFPIHSIKIIDHYHGDDNKSMNDNNSSAFNYRVIEGQSHLISVHSYGTAIDINPIQNPFIVLGNDDESAISVYPKAGKHFINRRNQRKGMVEAIETIFSQNGFPVWGGNWNDPLDWHHFQTSRLVAEALTIMSPDDAKLFFELTTNHPLFFAASTDRDTINTPLLAAYHKEPKLFLDKINQFLMANGDKIDKQNVLTYYEKLLKQLHS